MLRYSIKASDKATAVMAIGLLKSMHPGLDTGDKNGNCFKLSEYYVENCVLKCGRRNAVPKDYKPVTVEEYAELVKKYKNPNKQTSMKTYAIIADSNEVAKRAIILLLRANSTADRNSIRGKCPKESIYFVKDNKLQCVHPSKAPFGYLKVTVKEYEDMLTAREPKKEDTRPGGYTAIFGNFVFDQTKGDTCKVLTLEHVESLPSESALEQVCEAFVVNNMYDSYLILETYTGVVDWSDLTKSKASEGAKEEVKWVVNKAASDARIDKVVNEIRQLMLHATSTGCSSIRAEVYLAKNEVNSVLDGLKDIGLVGSLEVSGAISSTGVASKSIYCIIAH